MSILKRELKQIFPDIKVQFEEIKNVLLNEVIKRELLEGEESDNAKRKINKSIRKRAKEGVSKQLSSIKSDGQKIDAVGSEE